MLDEFLEWLSSENPAQVETANEFFGTATDNRLEVQLQCLKNQQFVNKFTQLLEASPTEFLIILANIVQSEDAKTLLPVAKIENILLSLQNGDASDRDKSLAMISYSLLCDTDKVHTTKLSEDFVEYMLNCLKGILAGTVTEDGLYETVLPFTNLSVCRTYYSFHTT